MDSAHVKMLFFTHNWVFSKEVIAQKKTTFLKQNSLQQYVGLKTLRRL